MLQTTDSKDLNRGVRLQREKPRPCLHASVPLQDLLARSLARAGAFGFLSNLLGLVKPRPRPDRSFRSVCGSTIVETDERTDEGTDQALRRPLHFDDPLERKRNWLSNEKRAKRFKQESQLYSKAELLERDGKRKSQLASLAKLG